MKSIPNENDLIPLNNFNPPPSNNEPFIPEERRPTPPPTLRAYDPTFLTILILALLVFFLCGLVALGFIQFMFRVSSDQHEATAKSVSNHCPTGYIWYKPTNMCYQLHTNKVNFDTANATCRQNGELLPSIHSLDQSTFLANFKPNDWDNGTEWKSWIGLHLDKSTNSWKWEDGSPTDFLAWGPGQPDFPDFELWVEILWSDWCPGEWNNAQMYTKDFFYCQRPNPSK